MRERIEAEERGPERTCIVTGRKGEPDAMLRFALSGEGAVTPDLKRKLPGRGVWTELNRTVVRQATQKQAFSRGFRNSVKAPADLDDAVDRLLELDALQFLSLVNKAGLVVTGAAKVESTIRAGAVVGIIHAKDGAADGSAKLDRLMNAIETASGLLVPRIIVFGSSQLDLALGKTNVIHAALNAGPASAAFLAKVARLTRYRSGPSPPAAAKPAGGDEGPMRDETDTSHERAGVTGNTHERNEQ